MSSFPISQDSASGEKGVAEVGAAKMGKTRPTQRRFGLRTRQQAPGKGGGSYHPGPQPAERVGVC